MLNISLPEAVVVSMGPSRMDRQPGPRSRACSITLTGCGDGQMIHSWLPRKPRTRASTRHHKTFASGTFAIIFRFPAFTADQVYIDPAC